MQVETADGWQLLATQPEPDEPPFEKYLITKIFLADAGGNRTLIATNGACELRTFGFPKTGNTLVVQPVVESLFGAVTDYFAQQRICKKSAAALPSISKIRSQQQNVNQAEDRQFSLLHKYVHR